MTIRSFVFENYWAFFSIAALFLVGLANLPDGQNWLDLLRASGFPSVGFFGAYFTWCNFKVSFLKRRDDLFDKRWDFYNDLISRLIDEADGKCDLPRNPMAAKAEFLFDKNAAKFVRELPPATQVFERGDFPVYIVAPFRRHMTLESVE